MAQRCFYFLVLCYFVLGIAACQRDKSAGVQGDGVSLSGFNAQGVYAAFYSPNGQQVAVGMGNGEVLLLEGDSLAIRWRKKIAAAAIHSTLFHPQGQLFAAPCYDGSVYICSTDSAVQPMVALDGLRSVNHAAFSTRGTYLAACGQDSMLRLFSYPDLRPMWQRRAGCALNYFWFTEADSVLVASGTDGCIYRWSTNTGLSLSNLCGHRGAVYSVFANNGSRVLVSAGADSMVRLWNLTSGRCMSSIPATDKVYVAMLSPDGQSVAYCQRNAEVLLRHLSTGHTYHLNGHTGLLCSLHFSPDGKRLLTGSMDGTLRLWDPATGQCIRMKKIEY